MLLDAVQCVRLPRHLDVVRDVRLLADEFVRLDDEAADVPGGDADEDVARGAGTTAATSHRTRGVETTLMRAIQRAGRQRGGHEQHAGHVTCASVYDTPVKIV